MNTKAGERMPGAKDQRNYHLDAIRVLAALSVVFTHLRGMFFVPYREAGTGVFVSVIYIQHYLTRGGVMCFFVLSGYLVGNSVLKSIKSNRWCWRDYLVRRITRLQIVLIPALVLTAIFDFCGSRISSTIYTDKLIDYSWQNFGGCLIFLQQVVKGFNPFGSNGPLWSLSYEFWYYILFPVIALLIIRRRQYWILVPILAAVVWLTFGVVLFLFSVWLAGVGAGYLSRAYPLESPLLRRSVLGFAILGFVATTLACGSHKLDLVRADYIYGFFTIPLVWACLCIPLRSPTSHYARTAILLSEFSYTLYLTHFPFLLLVKAVWLGTATWKPDGQHILLLLVPFAASILFAYGCYLLFESNTDQVRKFIHSKLKFPSLSTISASSGAGVYAASEKIAD